MMLLLRRANRMGASSIPQALRAKLRRYSWTIRYGARPIERDMFCRVRGVFEFKAERIDREDGRLTPGDKLRAGAGFTARRVHQPRIHARRAGRPQQSLGPSLDLAGDLDAPMGLIGRDLEGYFRALDAARLPPSSKAFVHPARKTTGATADDRRQGLHLAVISVFINVEPGDPARLARPEIALPPADPHEAQVIELNVTVMALADMPEQH